MVRSCDECFEETENDSEVFCDACLSEHLVDGITNYEGTTV